MPATPAAVLAQGDPVGVVALALIRLVVTLLALLASERDCDAYVSAGHVGPSLPSVVVYKRFAQAKKNPAWREVSQV
jgi:hypothetical protein